MHTHTHTNSRNLAPKAFLSQNCQFHEAELIHCTFLESASLFSLLPLLSFLLSPHPPLISLSNSLMSLSSPTASLFHSDILPASLFSDSLYFFSPSLFYPPYILPISSYIPALPSLFTLLQLGFASFCPPCATRISSFPSCKHLMDSDVRCDSKSNLHKTSYYAIF